MLYLGFGLKTFKLVVIIFNFSYFLGMLWYIVADIIERSVLAYREWYVQSYGSLGPVNTEFFMAYNNLDGDETYDTIEKTILIVYFSFTSLSTVGFGDFNPRSDAERLICAFMLLLGVAIFSLIMGDFQDMVM